MTPTVSQVGTKEHSSNHAEGYFSQLKRSLDGTHHDVSAEHLPRYLAEFNFRYTTRKLSDGQRMLLMLDQAAGRRLTYHPCADDSALVEAS